jgi:hypothetical protein
MTTSTSATSDRIAVAVQIAGLVGFVACVVVTIVVADRQLLALAGLCATVACGGYAVQARRNGKP